MFGFSSMPSLQVHMSNRVLYDAIFNPRAIALIGASADERKNTSRPQRFLRKHGYAGRIFPINPGREEIFGAKAYPEVGAVAERQVAVRFLMDLFRRALHLELVATVPEHAPGTDHRAIVAGLMHSGRQQVQIRRVQFTGSLLN